MARGRARSVGVVSICAALCLLVACNPSSAPATPKTLAGHGTTWHVLYDVRGSFGGMALDGQGDLYAVDIANNRIVELALKDGSLIRRWGHKGSAPGQLSQPLRTVLDKSGHVYVTDNGNTRVVEFTASGAFASQWGDAGSDPGQFTFPVGIAVGADGDVYVADVQTRQVQKFSAAGAPIASWSTDSIAGFSGGPADLALDAAGNLYVSEAYGSDHVFKLSPSGSRIASWGGTGSGPGRFLQPRGLALDKDGNLYVDDSGNNRIQELSPAGKQLAQWQGPDSVRLPEQSSLVLDPRGYLIVSDRGFIITTCTLPGGCS
jgi:DNA-binding beta-propeller fold protein YncE